MRDRELPWDSCQPLCLQLSSSWPDPHRPSWCVCVCVCVRERVIYIQCNTGSRGSEVICNMTTLGVGGLLSASGHSKTTTTTTTTTTLYQLTMKLVITWLPVKLPQRKSLSHLASTTPNVCPYSWTKLNRSIMGKPFCVFFIFISRYGWQFLFDNKKCFVNK